MDGATTAAATLTDCRRRAARQLARYLAAVHGGVSIADLFVPGRNEDAD